MSAVRWDVDKFQKGLAKLVRNRRLVSHSTHVESIVNCSQVIDQFLLFGVPPNQEADSEPQLLIAYPPTKTNDLHMDLVMEMALPTGTNRDYLRSNSKNSIQDQFVFTIVNGPTTLYGICVHVNPNSVKDECFFASSSTKNTTFAFVLLTKVPAIAAHMTFLYHLVLSSLNKTPKSDLAAPEPGLSFANDLLEDVQIDDEIAHHVEIEVPKFFGDLIKFYYSLTKDSPPLTLNREFQIFFPATTDNDAVLCYVLDTLFSLLSVENIVRVIGSLMLDAQVVVVGSNLHEVTSTVLALQMMVSPMKFCGPVIPVLPDSSEFLHLLESPTPFIIGSAPTISLRDLTFMDSSIFVYLDKRSISVGEYVNYPCERAIVKKMAQILSKEACKKTAHPFGIPLFCRSRNHKYSFSPMVCTMLRKAMQEPLKDLFSDELFSYFVTDRSNELGDGVTIFNSELFFGRVGADDRVFFKSLMESQNFEMFVEKRIYEYVVMMEGVDRIPHMSAFANSSKPERPRRRSINV